MGSDEGEEFMRKAGDGGRLCLDVCEDVERVVECGEECGETAGRS